MLHAVVVLCKACELLCVGIQHHAVFAFGGKETIVGEGLLPIPVEDKDKFAAAVSHHLVALVVPEVIYPRQMGAALVFLVE